MGHYGMNGNCYGRGDYYRGDYYRGDYYRGDPGILGTLFSLGKSFVTGGPVGLLSNIAGRVLKGKVASAAPAAQAMTQRMLLPEPTNAMQGTALAPLPPINTGPIQTSIGGFGAMNVNVGGGGYPMGGAGAATAAALAQCGVKGFHANKSTYVTRGGGTSRWPRQLEVHPKGSECVRRRRMNVGNARALRHALARARGFIKLAKRSGKLFGMSYQHHSRARKKRA